jgi:hypothetical protein
MAHNDPAIRNSCTIIICSREGIHQQRREMIEKTGNKKRFERDKRKERRASYLES